MKFNDFQNWISTSSLEVEISQNTLRSSAFHDDENATDLNKAIRLKYYYVETW